LYLRRLLKRGVYLRAAFNLGYTVVAFLNILKRKHGTFFQAKRSIPGFSNITKIYNAKINDKNSPTEGLLFMNLNKCRDPIAKEETIFPGRMFFFALVMHPRSTRSTTPSLNISV
jgi:hypothetical protein